MLKAYKYRLYPNKEQEVLLNKHFGCVRFVYNYSLNLKISAYQNENIRLSKFDLDKQLTELKKLGADWKLHDQEITKFIQQSLEGFRETILYKRKYFFLNKIEIHSEGIAKNMKLYLTIQQFPRIILELISIII